MTVLQSKIRIYDLAKELKLESKRLIEEVRREGVDVSVPSNTISKELAEKIRNKYFPKKEAAVQRVVRVVKKTARPADAGGAADDIHLSVPPPVADDQSEYPAAAAATAETAPLVADDADESGGNKSIRLLKKLPPAARAEQPTTVAEAPSATHAPEQSSLADDSAAVVTAEQMHVAADNSMGDQAAPALEMSARQPAPAAAAQGNGARQAMLATAEIQAPGTGGVPLPGQSRQITKQLRLTKEAISSGLRHGDRAPAPIPAAAAPPTPRERDRRGGGAAGPAAAAGGRGNWRERGGQVTEYAGTPGETANPQTVYTPAADPRGRGGRRVGARGGRGGAPVGNPRDGARGRGGRFDRDFVTPPRALSLEERIADTLKVGGAAGASALKIARIVEGSTVKELAEKLGIKPKDIVSLLLQRGVFATINQPLNDDVAVDLGRRFGYEVTFVPFEEMVAEEEFEELIATDADDVELPRAPVVTVMGHVDHGKTSLLDAIRTTDVAGGEAGGITQHIGAYSVQVPTPGAPEETRRVVFLDTPGHEAFTMMRARGAKATDVVVLVVAADDGVMPQTIEAIEHARAANVPIVVAINKIDKPDANPDRVKQELSGHGLQPVEWGGETEMVLVSAKQRQNLEALLETILLTADILDLKASLTRLASGVVLEAKLDRGRGSVATVLV